MLNIDDKLPFISDYLTDQEDLYKALLFARTNLYGVNNTVMWAPLLEKAWAKIRGNYLGADGGFSNTGISALTNAPVLEYYVTDFGDDYGFFYSSAAAFNLLQAADDAGYIMVA